MDYSLLLGIERLQKKDVDKSGFDDILDSLGDFTGQVHQIGAARMSRMIGVNAEEEVEMIDVGELMSRKHCFVSGEIVFHISVIDFF